MLRETKYKESDKILTVLTETEGKLTVSARGARRKNSKTGAASQLLTYSDMTLGEYKGRWYLKEASIIDVFYGIRTDMELLSLASYFAELMEAVSDEDNHSPEILRLGLNSIYASSVLKKPPKLVKAAFELRLMCLSGYEPQLYGCEVCGGEMPEEPMFSVSEGIIVCRKCRGADQRGIAMPLCPDSLMAMRHIVLAEPKRIFSFRLEGKALDRMADACEVYVLTQLERGFKTLDFWKSITN